MSTRCAAIALKYKNKVEVFLVTWYKLVTKEECSMSALFHLCYTMICGYTSRDRMKIRGLKCNSYNTSHFSSLDRLFNSQQLSIRSIRIIMHTTSARKLLVRAFLSPGLGSWAERRSSYSYACHSCRNQLLPFQMTAFCLWTGLRKLPNESLLISGWSPSNFSLFFWTRLLTSPSSCV